MNDFIKGLGFFALIVIFCIAKEPAPFLKLVRDAVGEEKPKPEQVLLKQTKERLDRGSQIPPMWIPADEARKQMREILGNGGATGN